MRNMILHSLVVAFIFSCVTSCGDDDPFKIIPPQIPTFKSLEVKDDVLLNLQLAYTQRNVDQYDRLLDGTFTFFFSSVDVNEGRVEVSQWDRASELTSAGHMFDPAFDPDGPTEPISDITLTMIFPAGEEAWNPQTDLLTGETSYEKTAEYRLSVTAGETTFTNAQPIDASFVIRFTAVGGDSIYRLVSWKDDI